MTEQDIEARYDEYYEEQEKALDEYYEFVDSLDNIQICVYKDFAIRYERLFKKFLEARIQRAQKLLDSVK